MLDDLLFLGIGLVGKVERIDAPPRRKEYSGTSLAQGLNGSAVPPLAELASKIHRVRLGFDGRR